MGKITKILTSKPLAKKIYKVPEDIISMIAMHLDQRLIIEQQKEQIAEQEAKIKEQDDYIQWTLKYCCEWAYYLNTAKIFRFEYASNGIGTYDRIYRCRTCHVCSLS